jgi:tetratricopeptide (TPR) repeat protein
LLPYYAYQRSVQLAQASQWSEAAAWSSIAQHIGPDVVWLLPNIIRNAYQWAQANFKAGRLDLAERFYHLITRWQPKDPVAWADLGAIAERRGHLDVAIAHYKTAIQIDPASEPAHYNLAVAYWKQSNWEQVRFELQRVLEINPNNTAARNYLMRVESRARTP